VSSWWAEAWPFESRCTTNAAEWCCDASAAVDRRRVQVLAQVERVLRRGRSSLRRGRRLRVSRCSSHAPRTRRHRQANFPNQSGEGPQRAAIPERPTLQRRPVGRWGAGCRHDRGCDTGGCRPSNRRADRRECRRDGVDRRAHHPRVVPRQERKERCDIGGSSSRSVPRLLPDRRGSDPDQVLHRHCRVPMPIRERGEYRDLTPSDECASLGLDGRCSAVALRRLDASTELNKEFCRAHRCPSLV